MLVKLEWLGYRMVKKLWRYVKPFSSDTGTLRTDGQTDKSCVCVCASDSLYGRSVLEMGSFVSVLSSAALMQKYEIGLYLLTAARVLIALWQLWFSATLLFVSALQAWGVHVAKWYELHGIVDDSRYLRRLTVFFTVTIYRGISWPWQYCYRHVGIDDKYRGIVGIAQHY